MKAKFLKIAGILFLAAVAVGTGLVLWTGFDYVRTSPRFSVRQITVQGLKRVEEDDVMDRINLRTGINTNIFAVDMEDVRMRVEQIQWVRHAYVARVLPDQIIVTVVERKPIGLALIQGHIYEFDQEAAILDPDKSARPQFPILSGMRADDTQGNLRKIAMYNKTLSDLGADGLSEIIVNSNNEVSVVKDGDPVIVVLGVDDFKERWSHYLALKEKINTEFKNAVRVDLRFRNGVVVSTEDDDDGKVIWDGKKKSL
jgi:cell division protein FtsQ